MAKIYLCPICKKSVGTYGSYCCGRRVATPEGDASDEGFFKILILCIGLPLILIACVGIGFMIVGQFRAWRNETMTVDSPLNLPITATNITVMSSSNVNLFIAPDGELISITPGARREPDVHTVIDTNVRSIEHVHHNGVMYIKNDNSLWGFGSNHGGFLGTGTGVNIDEPVKIMENVAKLYVHPPHASTFDLHRHRVYAVGINGTLWMWGNGDFSPVRVTTDVVRVLGDINGALLQKKDGVWFRHIANRNEIERVQPFAVVDFVGNLPGTGRRNLFIINSDNTLMRLTWTGGGGLFSAGRRRAEEEIARNVQLLWGQLDTRSYNLLFIKDDNSLWGFGVNASGEIGDGTRVSRQDAPVLIAENVASVGSWHYVSTNGELWMWDRNNPSPEMMIENVALVDINGTTTRVFLNDGTLITNFREWNNATTEARRENFVRTGIKIPQTIVFD